MFKAIGSNDRLQNDEKGYYLVNIPQSELFHFVSFAPKLYSKFKEIKNSAT